MKRSIYMWHGLNKQLKADLIKLPGVAEDSDGLLSYNGILDSFQEIYPHPIMVLSNGTICVTEKNSFGQQ